MLSIAEGDGASGLEHYRLACDSEPGNASLLVEAATAALAEGAAALVLELIERSGAVPSGRILLLEAQALALVGDAARAAAILRSGIEVAGLREGENAMAELWTRVCPGEPIPSEYQFSMNEEGRQ